jgi:hypothetical protein
VTYEEMEERLASVLAEPVSDANMMLTVRIAQESASSELVSDEERARMMNHPLWEDIMNMYETRVDAAIRECEQKEKDSE